MIGAQDLLAALGSDQPPVIADVRWELGRDTGRADFEAGHIPGAQFVDLDRELAAPPGAGGRHPLPPPEVFQQAMRRIGVSNDRAVVVYDAANSLAASRLWWLLADAGHDQVAVLDGGLAAWTKAGQPVTAGESEHVPAGDFDGRPGQLGQVDSATLAALIDKGEAPVLVDVRGAERYAGENEPIDPVAGHIPGAVSAPSMDNVDADGRFVAPKVLRERFTALGVDGDAVLYCGSGITAAHTLLAMRSAGIGGGTLYPGSWSDWIRDPDRPVRTGPLP
nr:sulfurtransferase [Microlunatus panaciterrae]